MEDPPKEGSEGYPEEQPGDVAGDDREGSSGYDDRERDRSGAASRGDDGKATGDRRSAG